MLNDGTGFKKVYLAAGFTDLRRGIDGLARIIRFQFQLDPYDKNTLFLFCGRRTDRIKGLGKAMDFSFCTGGLKMAAFDGPAQKMKHWRSPQTSIKC